MKHLEKIISKKPIILLVLACIPTITTSCMQNAAANSHSQNRELSKATIAPKAITKNTLKIVNTAFYANFLLSEWRFQGARSFAGAINAHIQIPSPLDMSVDVQKRYVQELICPSSEHKTMWTEIRNTSLRIHLYTPGQKHNLYVNCQNPYHTG